MRYTSPEILIAIAVLVVILMLLSNRGGEILINTLTVIISVIFILAVSPFLLVLDLIGFTILSLMGEGHRHKWLIPYMIKNMKKDR